ncbi:MAG: ABC transporter ATP-binding protein [Victivallales bacterium]|jgi:ABC-type lipoprotein export system ATPase subunit|nr:ABC transporter ATP-binding protein [Victivallales bacterium]MBR5840827.1 ABC transporter ATP-binding protein [Victivallales bacterium]
MESLFQIKNLCKTFSLAGGTIEVIKNLSLDLPKGEWLALTGPSGCGKTTLLHILAGLDRPTSGDILLDGQNIAKMSSSALTKLRKKRIGFVFQSYHLFPELSALENAALPALQWGVNRNQVYENAKKWLETFGLATRLNHRPRELSGGEQQRVAIARSLINNPDIILADEPTGNLDAKAAQGIIDILQHVRSGESKTLIMVTHDLNLAKQANRVIELKKQ